MTNSFFYSEDLPPVRLDKALARQLGFGVRRCRALIEAGHVLVDDRPCAKGALVRPGQHVLVSMPEDAAPTCHDVRLVARNESFAALFKPGGLHTVAGRGASCLESCLPGLGLEGWELLNRLDHLTSGLVLAAGDQQSAAAYKTWQDAGQVRKWYLALARGVVQGLDSRERILDDKRRVVRVTTEEDEPLRWTRARAVCQVGDDTLLLVRILKGRRHQIRAHLAHAGHALIGDPVYGVGEPGGLYLHHWRLEMPGFEAAFLPDWPCVDHELVESLASDFDSDRDPPKFRILPSGEAKP
ncbi:23S rRNA pseudouridine1911/1915/1917 synthase [Desulfomicrobium macestii]|uniref:23S rRNA pseudouridine1911/1915/1917 synthase n=1 Tax=Desulfomicrobium macestii TaxID=90731 RepID=A0ABR9H9E3_9BACT|nr:pseudouridine synthase [Desulfomicrobium macestii]MBE1427356.1 23S rRNA pseudouridine1911/1915/1917 synthase [Desulfomicrobium macestii]